MKHITHKYVTIKLTEDQLSWLVWILQTDIDSDPGAYLPQRRAFVRRLKDKLVKSQE